MGLILQDYGRESSINVPHLAHQQRYKYFVHPPTTTRTVHSHIIGEQSLFHPLRVRSVVQYNYRCYHRHHGEKCSQEEAGEQTYIGIEQLLNV